VQQEVNLVTNHSVAENVMLGRFPSSFGFVSARKLTTRVRELLRLVQLEHVDPETPAGALTPSEQRLVMVAAVLARDPRLLILDEPTAALPPEESAVVAKLVRELSADGVAVIYVSHRLHEVKDLCSRVIALRRPARSYWNCTTSAASGYGTSASTRIVVRLLVSPVLPAPGAANCSG
jgi:ribose transport system ATP-binding protein